MGIRRIGSTGTLEKEGPILVPGKVVRGRVLGRTGSGRFRINLSGWLLEADSDLPLEAGQKLLARVEVNNQKILLRIQDCTDWEPPADDIDRDEIKRVLEGLGLESDIQAIGEFQERLARYRKHGSLIGLEPSDVWVLAILWTRHIKEGSDAFALTSFFLRCLSLDEPEIDLNLPDPAYFLRIEDGIESEAEVFPAKKKLLRSEWTLISGLEERNQEAFRLFNRERSLVGGYAVLRSTHFRTFRQGDILQFWATNNPIRPDFVLEASRIAGEIRARLNLTNWDRVSAQSVNEWRHCWNKTMRSAHLEEPNITVSEVKNREELRFIFWRSGMVLDSADILTENG